MAQPADTNTPYTSSSLSILRRSLANRTARVVSITPVSAPAAELAGPKRLHQREV